MQLKSRAVERNSEDRAGEERAPHVVTGLDPLLRARRVQRCRDNQAGTEPKFEARVTLEGSSARRASLHPVRRVQTARERNRSVRVLPLSAAITDGWVRSGGAQRNVKVERVSTLMSVPRAGSTFWVGLVELRWTHHKLQRLFIRGRRLKGAVTCLCLAPILPSG